MGFPASRQLARSFPLEFDPGREIYLWEDFEHAPSTGGPVTSGLIGRNNWTVTCSGTGAQVSNAADNYIERSFGSLMLETGSTAAGRAAISYSNGNHPFNPSDRLRFTTRIKLSALSDGTNAYTARVGFQNSFTAAALPSAGVYFEYLQTTSLNWRACVVTGSSNRTEIDTGIPVQANVQTYLEARQSAGRVDFFIGRNFVATISSNLPENTPARWPAFILAKTVGVTNRTMKADFWFHHGRLAIARG